MDIIEDFDVEDHQNDTREVDDNKNKRIQDWQRLAKTEILKLYFTLQIEIEMLVGQFLVHLLSHILPSEQLLSPFNQFDNFITTYMLSRSFCTYFEEPMNFFFKECEIDLFFLKEGLVSSSS